MLVTVGQVVSPDMATAMLDATYNHPSLAAKASVLTATEALTKLWPRKSPYLKPGRLIHYS